jgi:cytochrome-b5 reductase
MVHDTSSSISVPMVAAITVGVLTVAWISLTFAKRAKSGKKHHHHKPALHPEDYREFELKDKVEVSHDTRIFRFALHHPEQPLGLPIGQHMMLKATVDGKEILRSYTPITGDEQPGHFDLMVKVYFGGVHPKFPEGGKMSQHLEKLKIGDKMHIKGPTGRIEYKAHGHFVVKTGRDQFREVRVKRVGMIAGGTGVTPMLQIIRHILKDPTDPTQLSLLFANQTEEDILLRKELEECTKDPRFKLWYTLDRSSEQWSYSKGFVDYDMVEKHMPAPGDDAVILMCGPLPMVNFACKPNLEKRGFTEQQMIAF